MSREVGHVVPVFLPRHRRLWPSSHSPPHHGRRKQGPLMCSIGRPSHRISRPRYGRFRPVGNLTPREVGDVVPVFLPRRRRLWPSSRSPPPLLARLLAILAARHPVRLLAILICSTSTSPPLLARGQSPVRMAGAAAAAAVASGISAWPAALIGRRARSVVRAAVFVERGEKAYTVQKSEEIFTPPRCRPSACFVFSVPSTVREGSLSFGEVPCLFWMPILKKRRVLCSGLQNCYLVEIVAGCVLHFFSSADRMLCWECN
jgi:hypothetical protein